MTGIQGGTAFKESFVSRSECENNQGKKHADSFLAQHKEVAWHSMTPPTFLLALFNPHKIGSIHFKTSRFPTKKIR